MLRLTEEIGRPVTARDGRTVGRILDLTVRIDGEPAVVERIAVGRHRIDTLVPRTATEDRGPRGLHIRVDTHPAARTADGSLPLDPDELLLRRDVLDTQIVDVAGRRVQRVGDVLLAPTPDDRLEVIAVDVGAGPVLRRLGLRRVADRTREQAVAWGDLHLTSPRGHRIQLAGTAAAVHRLDDAGLAHLIAVLPTEHAADVVGRVGPERAAAALAASHGEVGTRVTLALGEAAAEPVLAALPRAQARHLRSLRRDRAVRRRFLRLHGWRGSRASRP